MLGRDLPSTERSSLGCRLCKAIRVILSTGPLGDVRLAERTSHKETRRLRLQVSDRMPECMEKVISTSIFLLLANCVIPASAFRYQGQSSTAGHGLDRYCPAMYNSKFLRTSSVWIFVSDTL